MLAFARWCWRGPGKMAVGRHTRAICERLTKAVNDYLYEGKSTYLLINTPPRHGKACAVGTMVPTPHGFRTIESLRPGDYVFGRDGSPTKVVATSPIWRNRELYEVVSDDGASVVVDAEHEWTVRLCRKHKVFKTKTTKQLAERDSPRKPALMTYSAVQCAEADLPIHPYVLGVWLGDGTSDQATITEGAQDYDFIRAEVERCGYLTTNRSKPGTFGVKNLHKNIRAMGLMRSKHIPGVYLTASVGQRLALLQGLIDTDGYVAPDGQIEFCSINEELASNTLMLVRSLGVKASMIQGDATLNGKFISRKYRVMFYMAGAARIPRKASRCRSNGRTPHRFLTFKPAGRGDTVCIQVEAADQQYLVGHGFLLTHNSELLSRTFPAFFLARCASKQPSVIMSGYGASLVEGFSRQCKSLIRSSQFRELFPDIEIDRMRDSVDSWAIKGSRGEVSVVGLGGAITGKGGNAILLDDAVKSREEAYSPIIQERSWHSFTSDLMTRKDPGGVIVIVLMTRWHLLDIGGKIIDSMENNPVFPRFEVMTFPAKNPPEYDYLFPELYSPEWYEEQYAFLGPTMASALMDCNPVGEGNRIFNPEWIKTVETMPDASTLRIYIMVDSANSKLIGKAADPDYTVMTVWGWGRDNNYYLLDAIRDRLDLSGRTETIFSLVERWRPITVFWESVGAMADTQHIRIEQDRRGYHFSIVELKQRVPKADRINWLVPLFEQSKIWLPHRILRSRDDGRPYDFVNEFINDEFSTYPACRHDDMLDCMANLCHPTVVSNASFPDNRSSDVIRKKETWTPF